MTQQPRHRLTQVSRAARVAGVVGCVALAGALINDARGDSVVQFMTSKSLPDATVAVIDPESGTSSGTGGSDVNLAVGDIILFKFSVASAPAVGSAAVRGIQTYLTEYVPPGTEVVGVRITDADGNTLEPRRAGLALDGCSGGSSCVTVGAMPTGSIAQVHADTGIFYTTDPLGGDPVPNDQFLTTDNGITMNPEPRKIDPSIVQVLNDLSGTYFAHNEWDWDQVQGFGTATSTFSNGLGNTPFGYGSPVAGPDTFYRFEVTDDGTLGLDGVVGPWERIKYPGSQIGTGVSNIGSTTNMTRVGVDTAAGHDLTPATPLDARAIRFALGEAEVGEERFVEVALRVTSVPIDPSFGVAGGNVDCGEVFGTDLSSSAPNAGGAHNPWPTFVPHAQCVFLRTKLDLEVDKVLASGGNLTYHVDFKNLSVADETNARIVVKYVSSDQAFVSAVPMFDSTAPCAAPDGDKTCLTWNLGTVAPSDEFAIDLVLTTPAAGKRTGVVRAQYLSNELTAIDAAGFTTTAMTVVVPNGVPALTLNNTLDVTANFAAAGTNTWAVDGTIANVGTDSWTSDTFTVVLPDGTWGVRNAGGTTNNRITVGGVDATCTADSATIAAAAGSATRATNVVTITTTANHPFDVGDIVTISGVGNTSFNGTFTITQRVSNTQFRYVQTGTNATSSGGAVNDTVRVCTRADTYAPLTSRTLAFRVIVPATALDGTAFPAGVYTIGMRTFGNAAETDFHKILEVPVGAVRTQPPVLQCQPPTNLPIASTTTSISGTSEANAAIDLLFNLQSRGSATASGAGAWTSTNFLPGFGELYGGLEVRATAQAPGELVSVKSVSCFVVATKQCSDGIDNDGDGLIDFPADVGCASPADNTETDPAAPQCADGLDNNGTGGIDWPADPSCTSPSDDTEDGQPACSDGVDNDGDGDTDFPADADCTSATDGTEVFYRQCQDGIDNDGDGDVDFPDDPGCHSAFDDLELDTGFTPVDTKARLLIALDSSGSMNWNTCADEFTGGDGSTECAGGDVACGTCNATGCGNGIEDDSRLFKVKNGIGNVVAAFGEVEYSLMRFHQRSDDFACPTAAASLRSGGWQGGGAAPCAGGFAAGDLLVSFDVENEQTLLGWVNHDSDYDGVAPIGTDFEVRGSGTTPLAGILDSAQSYLEDVQADDLRVACRPYVVILVTDGAETCGGIPTDEAAALRLAGIPVYVIGFATPDPTVIANLDAIADAGGTAEAILVNDEAALSSAIAQIIEDSILVESCNDLDDDCDTLVDEDFPDKGLACDNGEEGECFDTGTRVCAGDGSGTVCNAPDGNPVDEVCNGLDDNCNGLVDEGLGPSCTCVGVPEICNGLDDDCDLSVDEGTLPGEGDTCGIDIGECSPGTLDCQGGQLVCTGGNGDEPETCNTLDDDCDTFVDEVVEVCYEAATGCDLGTGTCVGVCQPGIRVCDGNALGDCVGDVTPTTEVCNALDDDCNGATDDGLGLGDACDNGQQGVCRRTGVLVCDGVGGVECSAPTIPPGIEVCNGLDDDCDGDIDEELGAPIGDACGGGGSCSGGTFQCVDPDMDPGTPNSAIECVGSSTGTAEVCNGLDEDCDLQIDEDLTGFGGDCIPAGIDPYMETGDPDYCRFGHLECVGGVEDCRDAIPPQPEVSCNGIDEDCDGMDDQTCPVGEGCVEDACREPCGPGEFPCPFGQYCLEVTGVGDFCVPDPCASIQCPTGFYCDRDTEACVDLCDDVNCPGGTECVNGICQDCFALGCAEGEVCVRNTQTNLGECIADPCFGVECEAGQFCRDGACVETTCEPECPSGQLCDEGTCVDDPCDDVACDEGRICDPESGTCVSDQCVDVRCNPGEACNPHTGDCIPDPCLLISCGEGTVCVVLPDDTATCRVPPPPPSDRVFAGGGGCSAGGGVGGSVPGALLVLGWLGILRVSRRRPGRKNGCNRRGNEAH